MAQQKPFPIDPELTAIAINYRNKQNIADQVMPRISPLGKEEFKYFKYNLKDGFTVPDTKVGRRSQVNEIEFTGEEVDSSTDDYGLEDPIPQVDIDSAMGSQHNPLQRSTEMLTDIIDLGREVRVANIVMSTASYAPTNVQVLTAADKIDAFATSDPLEMLEDALNQMVMRANTAVLPQGVWSVLRRHPKINKAVNANSGDTGLATLHAVAEMLELEQILIGRSWANVANIGQAPDLQRAWQGGIALLHLNQLADNRTGTTWGFTAPYKTRVVTQKFDDKIGLRGGIRVRVGEGVKEVVSAPDLGYFLSDVLT